MENNFTVFYNFRRGNVSRVRKFKENFVSLAIDIHLDHSLYGIKRRKETNQLKEAPQFSLVVLEIQNGRHRCKGHLWL